MNAARADSDGGVVEARRHAIGGMPGSISHHRHLHLEWRSFGQSADVEVDVQVAPLRRAADGVDEHAEWTLAIHRDTGRAAGFAARGPTGSPERREGQY